MELLLNVTLINHSCAPNAFVERTEDQNNEVRAIKDISKGEEVTIFYKCFNDYTYMKLGWKVKERTKVFKKIFGFDCKCCVCSGIVPGQEDITKELIELHEALRKEKTEILFVKALDKIVDLSLRLYVGHLDDKIRPLDMLASLGYNVRNEEILGKAKRQLKKLAEDTKLKDVMDRVDIISNIHLS